MDEIKELLNLMISRRDNFGDFLKLTTSPNGVEKYSILNRRLCALLSLIYDKEIDKLEWLKREFNQFEDISSTVFFDEDEEFNSLYAQSGFKFDAIPYYLEEKEYKACFDIASFIITLFNKGNDIVKYKIVSMMCCSSAVFTALKKNQDTLNLLVLVAEYYYKQDVADGTFMLNVNYYITFECTPEEIEWMKKASPVYFGSFYDEKRSIDD